MRCVIIVQQVVTENQIYGDLFEADNSSGDIYEFTPNGSRSTFAGGLSSPWGVASAPVPVPEPAALTLLVTGLLGFGVVYLRRRGARRG